ncbi:MAG: hypothetical protein WD894_15080 [Pirellulales bacterium]
MAKPEKIFRMGQCRASVFLNSGKSGDFHSVALQRRYKDGDEWKSSSNFAFSDLPHAIAVLQMAMNHIAPIEGESSGDK